MQALMNYPSKGRYLRYLADQKMDKVLLFTCNQQQAEYTYHSKNKNNEVNLAKFSIGEVQRLAYVAQFMGVFASLTCE